jgi:hypothetical protein
MTKTDELLLGLSVGLFALAFAVCIVHIDARKSAARLDDMERWQAEQVACTEQKEGEHDGD